MRTVINTEQPWWPGAAIYQVYIRSFADGNGDGVGDLAGLRARLPYLAGLGVDAVWVTPWFPSPMADGGYDVADYRAIDPAFGTLAEAEKLVEEAHSVGLRMIIDLVPNHCSDEHAWFRAALAAPPGSPQRERFVFRDGVDGGPPNGWESIFGGPAWTQVPDGQWYLHLFDTAQPDFNWHNPEVRAEFLDIVRFWLDRGVDGIRIDSVAVLLKDFALGHPESYTDRDGIHDIYREWRRVADTYPGDRLLIGEIWLPDHERFSAYLRPDELHTAFNFEFLCAAWDAASLRTVVDATLAAHAPVAAHPTWVLSNHDTTRHVTRYGRADTTFAFGGKLHRSPTDPALGTRRARAAALLSMALPGGVYVYQGEELGLPEVEDLPDSARQDPMYHRTNGADAGRDGCRVPIPWSGTVPPYGFSPADQHGAPWLPQPADWASLTVAAQSAEPGSMLELYRTALRIRRREAALGAGAIAWRDDLPDGVLAFDREPGFTCVVNLSPAPVVVPAHTEVLLSSVPLDGDRLPTDAAVWLST
jgi:alpha-glucosidase